MRKYLCLLFCFTILIGIAHISDATEQIEAIKAKNAAIEKENALISKANAAVNSKNWREAENISKQLIALNPDRWEYQRVLADAELNLGKYQDALMAYEKAISLAGKSTGGDFKVATPTIKKAVSEMFVSEGNAYIKLRRNNDAIAAYTKAAELSDKPGTAYFNLCATQYNTGNVEGALQACDRAIQFDPNRADAYFIKGSVMIGNSTMDKSGKFVAPAGTAEALHKYLELAPNGAHAADVKEMLKMIE